MKAMALRSIEVAAAVVAQCCGWLCVLGGAAGVVLVGAVLAQTPLKFAPLALGVGYFGSKHLRNRLRSARLARAGG